MLAPNPTTKRAQRVKWSFKPQTEGTDSLVAYGTLKNFVLRDLSDPLKSKIFSTKIMNDITCVKYSPNGYAIAVGDEKGGLKLLGWSNAENDFVISYENDGFLGGKINDISWTDDAKKILVVGEGQKRAVAINVETKTNAGDLICHSANLMTCDIKNPKPYKAIVSGEDKEI